jgi:hypothetical protein
MERCVPDLSVKELNASEVASFRIFKVVDGSSRSIIDYNNSSCTDLSTTVDWSAMYTQLTEEHAESSLGYRWDAGCTEAHLRSATLQCDTRILRVSGTLMCQGHVCGSEKALALKIALGLDPSKPLMTQLTRQTALLVAETDDCTSEELVIPHSQVQCVIRDDELVRSYSRPKWM